MGAQRESPQGPSISNFPSLPEALDFRGLTSWFVKLSDTYSGLRKDGQVEGKVQGELRGVVRVCPLLQCVPALGANQMVVPHGKHQVQVFLQLQN